MIIKLYGERVADVQDGQLFRARIKSIEGRKFVELIEVNEDGN